MIRNIYFIILTYFLLGGLAFYFINRNKEPQQARQGWVKYASYFVIIHVLFLSIVIDPRAFRWLAVIIVATGIFELFHLFFRSGYQKKRFFAAFLLIFLVFSFGFLVFSGLSQGLILFTFLVLSIFDAFSQVTGQLFGRHKIFPKISPNKTVEGLIGGVLIAIVSAVLIEGLISASPTDAMLMAAGVAVFALVGDVATSWYKRQYGVKDFNRLIPGHGGFLDRFDSLIGGGAWIAFLSLLMDVF